MKPQWKTYKNSYNGFTIVEVYNDKTSVKASLTAYKARTIPIKEFQRLVKQLQETLELMGEK